MNIITILQVSESVARKSMEMAGRDPHGLIITVVSVGVVFAALLILYYAYTLVGKVVNYSRKAATDKKVPDEIQAAIGMALHQHFNETSHDNESYIITIRRKQNVTI